MDLKRIGLYSGYISVALMIAGVVIALLILPNTGAIVSMIGMGFALMSAAAYVEGRKQTS